MKILRNNQGLALFAVIFVMAFFLLFVTGSLVFSQRELKKTSNHKLATQAVEMADGGLQHALALIPWVWDFDPLLNCGASPCTIVSSSYPSIGFNYTVTAKNDPPEAVPIDDTNNTIVLTSTATGPNGTTKVVEAYASRSVAPFAPPAAFYVKAASASPQVDSSYASANGFFDINENTHIIGSDTNPGNLSDPSDDTSGPKTPIWGMAATSNTITDALKQEYAGVSNLHDVLGVGAEPSISAVSDVLDVDKIAANFFDHPAAVKFLDGLNIDSLDCPSAIPDPSPNPVSCDDNGPASQITLGTSSTPQIVYIKDNAGSNTVINGNVTGYGVVVFEGRTTIRGSFKYYGLVVHKRSDAGHYLSIEDNAWIYGGVLLGSHDEDGTGPEGPSVRFGIKDYVRIFYSSQALTMVDNNWGPLLPRPARIFAWLDK